MILKWVFIILIKMKAIQQNPLKQILVVIISDHAAFKYILITCQAYFQGKKIEFTPHFIRGHKALEYHKQNFQKFIEEIKAAGFSLSLVNSKKGHFQATKGALKLRFQCPGGGRIEHNYQGKKCNIFGYSKSYGRVDHKIAQQLVSTALNYSLNEITTSQQGY